MTQYKVIGPLEVDGKPAGEIVDLNPDEVNISALLAGGHIEPMERPEEQGTGQGTEEQGTGQGTEEQGTGQGTGQGTEESASTEDESEPVTTEDVS